MCMCIYRYCRALACQSPASNTLRNVKVELSNNSKKLQASRANPPASFDKKYLTNVSDGLKRYYDQLFIMEFIQIQKYLIEDVKNSDQFNSLLRELIGHLCLVFIHSFHLLATLLKNDLLSTPLIFRITVISIFAAVDGWRVTPEGSRLLLSCIIFNRSSPLDTTDSQLYFWLDCLILYHELCMNLLISLFYIQIIKYCMIPATSSKELSPGKFILTHRHIPSIYIFIEWLQLQNQEGYRPKVLLDLIPFTHSMLLLK